MQRVPGVSTISTGPTLNPGGCRLTEITKDKSLGAVDPRCRGVTGKAGAIVAAALRKAGPPVGRKRAFLDHVFLKRELRYFRGICGRACVTKRMQDRRTTRARAAVSLATTPE